MPNSPTSPEHAATSWSLAQEIAAVRDEAVGKSGRVARMLLKSAEVRVVAVGMAKDATWPEHSAKGRVLIRIEHGSIDVRTTAGTSRFGPGMLVAFEPGEAHDVHAIEDAAFLLIVSG